MSIPNIPATYWEEKILHWERLRYSKWFFFYPISWTVRNRLYSSIDIIKNRVHKNWSVLELGCGSGILASYICDDVGDYTGIDIARNAISFAKRKIMKPNIKFIAGDVLKENFDKKDIVLFLGLTDWLEPEQLRDLLLKINSDHLFFSYTDNQIVSRWSPYYYYRKIMDRKAKKYFYKARCYSEIEIVNLLGEFGYFYEVVKPASLINPGVLVWAKK